MIAIEQIRAARGMLNWTQRELAAAAGISLRNLHNIEAGLVVPRLETIKAIKSALEKASIEFNNGSTVTLRREVFDMEKREGEGALEFLVHDFMEAYRQGTKELLLYSTEERRWIELTTAATAEAYFRTMTEHGAQERCLIVHGDRSIMGFPSSYRWIPKEYFSEVCYGVYAETLTLIVWHPIIRIAFIRNAAIADGYRRHFEFIWERSEVPPFVKLAQQYPSLNKPRAWMSEMEILQLQQAEDQKIGSRLYG